MKTTNKPRNQTRALSSANPRSRARPAPARRRRQPTTAWIEQQRLMAIPTEWEIDPQTCKIGLEAIANIRAMFNAAEEADGDLADQPSARRQPVSV